MTESLIVQLCGYWLTITINQNYVCRPEINEEKCYAKITCDTGQSYYKPGIEVISETTQSIDLTCGENKMPMETSFSYEGELWMGLTCRKK